MNSYLFKNRSLPPPQFCGSMQVPRPWGNRSIRVHGRERPEYRACLFGQKVRQFLGNLALLVSRVLFSGSAEVHWVSRILPGTILHDWLAGQQKVQHCSFHCPQLRNRVYLLEEPMCDETYTGEMTNVEKGKWGSCWPQAERPLVVSAAEMIVLGYQTTAPTAWPTLLGFAGESGKMPEGQSCIFSSYILNI